MWPNAPGQAIAGVKGQHDGKQHDLNLSEETSEEIFARGFHSTCCPMTSSTGQRHILPSSRKLLFSSLETFLFYVPVLSIFSIVLGACHSAMRTDLAQEKNKIFYLIKNSSEGMCEPFQILEIIDGDAF